MSTIEVVGFGAMNVDHIYRVERILSDGEAPIEDYQMLPGGSAANTVYGLAKLGVGCGFIGAVGDDQEGEMLLRDLEMAGVDTGRIKKKGAKTGSAICLADREGRRALYISPGANSLLRGDDIELAYISQAKILHLSSFADEGQMELQKELVRRIPPQVEVSFAPGSIYAAKGIEAIAPIIRRAHIMFLNREEAEELTGEEFQRGAKKLLEQGCQMVAITLGEGIKRGKRTATCYVAGNGLEYTMEREKRVPAGDTIGAGDAFAAGFLYGLLHGKGVEGCASLGDMLARLSTTKIGARAGLPSLEELRQQCQREGGLISP